MKFRPLFFVLLGFLLPIAAFAQTSQRYTVPYATAFDATGVVTPGAQLFFYITGTSTPVNTYSNVGLTIPNANPVVANGAGLFPSIYLTPGQQYKVVLEDSANNQIWSADPVFAAPANLSAFVAPPAWSLSSSYPVLYYIPIQGCDGTTDKHATLAAANALASTNGSIYVGGGECAVASNISLTKAVTVAPGGMFKPANGVTVTFTGPVDAAAYQICDTSAGGMCDFTGSPSSTPVEWFGVSVGNSGSANKPLIDAALAHGSYNLLFQTPGQYLSTCNALTGVVGHKITGLGKSPTSGEADVVNGIHFTGCAYPYASEIPSDILASQNVGFYNDVQTGAGARTLFNSISVAGAAGVIANAIGWSTSKNSTMYWLENANNSFFTGYCGWLWEWGNENTMSDDDFVGAPGASTGGAECFSLPNVSPQTSIQKITHIGGSLTNTQNSSGWLLWQSNAAGEGSTGFSGIQYYGTTFEFSYNGFLLSSASQSFDNVHIERIANTLSTESASSPIGRSVWSQPVAQGGNSVVQLGAGLSPLSTINTVPALQGVQITLTPPSGSPLGGPMITAGMGAPSGACTPPSMYFRTDGTSGSNIYVCTVSATWNAISGV